MKSQAVKINDRMSVHEPYFNWVRIDLHGYKVKTALAAVDAKVREAWANHYWVLWVIHGSRMVRSASDAARIGAGGLKWRLRDEHMRGRWDRYVHHPTEAPPPIDPLSASGRTYTYQEALLATIRTPPEGAKLLMVLKWDAPMRFGEDIWSPFPPDDYPYRKESA